MWVNVPDEHVCVGDYNGQGEQGRRQEVGHSHSHSLELNVHVYILHSIS